MEKQKRSTRQQQTFSTAAAESPPRQTAVEAFPQPQAHPFFPCGPGRPHPCPRNPPHNNNRNSSSSSTINSSSSNSTISNSSISPETRRTLAKATLAYLSGRTCISYIQESSTLTVKQRYPAWFICNITPLTLENLERFWAVLWIRDILVRIRILLIS